MSAVTQKALTDYFASGARVVWIIHPDEQFVEVCHSRTQRRIVGLTGSLDGEHLLPGFRLSVADLFRPWDWE